MSSVSDMARSSEGRTRLVVADDDERFRRILCSVLATDGYDVVAETGDRTEVAGLVAEHQPDVVVLDLVMQGVSDLSTLRSVQAARPGQPVVVISSLFDPLVEQDVVAAGARYVEKAEGIDVLEQAVDALADTLSI